MSGEIVQLDDFRKPKPTDGMTTDEKTQFAVDTIADKWAGELVNELISSFSARGSDIDLDDPVYIKLMDGLLMVTRSITRHHLDVFDEVALTLAKFPAGKISVGVLVRDEKEN